MAESTEPTEPTEQDRQEKLRKNSSFDPASKTIDDLNPMEADSWSGGSINPDAKKVARGELPANHGRGGDMPPTLAVPDPTTVTRPWAPEPETETETSEEP